MSPSMFAIQCSDDDNDFELVDDSDCGSDMSALGWKFDRVAHGQALRCMAFELIRRFRDNANIDCNGSGEFYEWYGDCDSYAFHFDPGTTPPYGTNGLDFDWGCDERGLAVHQRTAAISSTCFGHHEAAAGPRLRRFDTVPAKGGAALETASMLTGVVCAGRNPRGEFSFAKQAAEAPPVEVCITLLSGKVVTKTTLPGSATVKQLRHWLAGSTERGAHPAQLRLILGGNVVSDQALLGTLALRGPPARLELQLVREKGQFINHTDFKCFLDESDDSG